MSQTRKSHLPKQNLWQQAAIAVLTSLLFAGSFVAGRYTTKELSPLLITFLRYLVALAFLQLMVWYQARQHRTVRYEQAPQLTVSRLSAQFSAACRRDQIYLVLLGTTGVIGYHVFFFASLRYTVLANSAIINAFNPVVTGFLAAVTLKERLAWQNYVGGAIAILSILILLTSGNLAALLQLQFNAGDLLMLCAVVCWACYSILLRHLGERFSGLAMSYYAALFGVVQLIALVLPALLKTGLPSLSLATILGILYMGIGASGIGYLLFTLSTQRIGPTKSISIVSSGVPVWVALLAWLFFKEPVTPWMLLSMAFILFGLRTVLQPKKPG